MAKGAFDKFINNEPKGAKKKEMVRVEKRKAKAEARIIGEQKRREKWEKQHGVVTEKKEAPAAYKKPPVKAQDRAASAAAENKTTPEKKFSKKYIRSNSDKYFTSEKDAAARIKSPVATDKTLTTKPDGNRPANKGAQAGTDEMPLNKYIAHSGVCGRREAAEMVRQKLVTVNGDIVYEPGYKVSKTDEVKVKGKLLHLQKNLVYILLNKPKDFLTTSADPEGRKTVLDLLKGATPERIYPVGRLDRNTTGVLLLTNDGELAQKLTHPSFQIKKVYAVKLDKPLAKKDFEAIVNGITLEDGEVHADTLAYADAKDKSQVGIEIHSGRNRIVRRIFEHLGYEVKTLDRVMFANLTKKNVERSKWRFLNDKEVRLLKFMNQSFMKKNKTEETFQDNLPE